MRLCIASQKNSTWSPLVTNTPLALSFHFLLHKGILPEKKVLQPRFALQEQKTFFFQVSYTISIFLPSKNTDLVSFTFPFNKASLYSDITLAALQHTWISVIMAGLKERLPWYPNAMSSNLYLDAILLLDDDASSITVLVISALQ